jgi:hypothetical protein
MSGMLLPFPADVLTEGRHSGFRSFGHENVTLIASYLIIAQCYNQIPSEVKDWKLTDHIACGPSLIMLIN